MARSKKMRVVLAWSAADLKTLKKLAGKQPAATIARQLKRSESAVRQKAGALGVSLRV